MQVVDSRAQEEAEKGKNDLLSAFNVATFKSDEDDATFWNRLITDGGPARDEGADGDDDLMPRTARLKGGERNSKGEDR